MTDPSFMNQHYLRETLRGFARLALPYWTARGQWRARFLLASMLALGMVQVVLAVRLNIWSADLFDALERHSTPGLVRQAGIFLAIVLGVMIVNAIHLGVKRALQLGWRTWLTERLTGVWLEGSAAYRLNALPQNHRNPDGRIAEDIRVIAEAAIELLHSLFYCLLLLVSFASILWSLSGVLDLEVFGQSIALPGHMVFIALLYSSFGSMLAMVIGRRLVSVADWRQTAEAELRSSLISSRDNAEAIAVARGAAFERNLVMRAFDVVALSWRSQTSGLRQLIMFTSSYATLATFFPILIGIPRYLAGDISLGGLVQTGQAFQQTTSALSWPVDNFPRLAELRASVERVLELDADLHAVRQDGAPAHDGLAPLVRIVGTSQAIGLHGLQLFEPDGRLISYEIEFSVDPGEHVQVTGDPHAASVLCRVMAGIWPWASGRIELPVMAPGFLQAVPRLPMGTLRQALCYPETLPSRPTDELKACLAEAGLTVLVSRLDEVDSWSEVLNAEQQQRLGFARLILQKPSWILLDQTLEVMSSETEEQMLALIDRVLPDAAVIASDHRVSKGGFFTRNVVLSRTTDGKVELQEAGRTEKRPALPAKGKRLGKLMTWVRAGFGEE